MGYDASATLGFGVQFKRLEETGGTDEAIEFPEWVEEVCWDPNSEAFKHIRYMVWLPVFVAAGLPKGTRMQWEDVQWDGSC